MTLDFKKFLISILLVGLFMGLDLWSKYAVSNGEALHGIAFGTEKTITITKPIINYGGTGVFSSGHPDPSYQYWHIFLVVVAACCFISMVLANQSRGNSLLAAIAVGGVWGNVFELMVFGGATDFLETQGFAFFDAYIFNVADIFILVGTPLYLVTSSLSVFGKLVSLIIFGLYFAVSFGFIPAEPIVFIAIGSLLFLLWSPTTEGSSA